MGYKVVVVVFVVLLCSLSNKMSNADEEDGSVKALRANMKRLHPQQPLRGAVHRSITRLKTIQTSIASAIKAPFPASPFKGGIEAPVNVGEGEFVATISIGTPPIKMAGSVDTGSDLIWTQCKPCANCFSQPDPIFDPSKSTTYAKLPCPSSLCSSLPNPTCSPDCQYLYQYMDGSNTSGVLSSDTLTMLDTSGGEESIPGVAFGCSHDTRGQGFNQTDGLIGLGRGDLSLISQLSSASVVESKFSYCLINASAETSPLLLGTAAGTLGEGAKSTPILTNSVIDDQSFYYLSVEGMSVGNSRANISERTFDIKGDGNGGFVIDSGTTYTMLPRAAFTAVAQLLDSAIGLPRAQDSDFSLCYQLPSSGSSSTDKLTVPDITFHFGGCADYVVRGEYSFETVPDTNLLCFLMLESSSGLSIFGNFQQQNYHILYDNFKHMLSFAPAVCASL
ncbi:hypothetical protein KI387_032698 [Taxus chinensis]|uniref:nepenthesin n=1 Tax=Taxus chinensis TaxID=29808 RepID=A0AA38F460_TAXCH|nr:hypothetical protein KI387_032698 [Taxus chinensis]